MASGEIMILLWCWFDFFLQSELDLRDFILVKLFWIILYPQFKAVTQGIVPLIWDLNIQSRRQFK